MFFYDFVKWFWIAHLFCFGPKRIYYRQNRKAFKSEYIISANHISYTDILKSVWLWFRRISYVATEHLYEDKVRGWLMTKSRYIY